MSDETIPQDGTDIRPLSGEGVHSAEAWKQRISAALDATKGLLSDWKANVKRYEGKYLTTAPTADTVVVPKDYANVEQKKARLMFQSPQIQLTAKQPGYEQTAHLFAAVINQQLKEMDAIGTVDECLFDVLCPAGIAATEIGYEATTVPVMVPEIDPQMAQLAGIPPEMVPMVPTQRTIHQRYYFERVTPGLLLIPDDFTGSNFDEAAWLGVRYQMDAMRARQIYQLGPKDGTESSATDDDRLLSEWSKKQRASSTPKLTCTRIWYKAYLFDPTIKNPEQYAQLVFIDGVERPVVHRLSPYQVFDQNGRFVSGMKGNPIHPLTLRYTSDQPIPKSDCSMTGQQVDELSKFRSQMVQQRARSMPQRWYDTGRVGQEFTDRIKADGIESAAMQALIPINGNGNEAMGVVATAQYPRENFTANDYIDKDIAETWALGSNQLGVTDDTARTATELSLVGQATDVRLDKERNRVLGWYAKAAEKIGALVQMFAEEQQFVAVLGEDGASQIKPWDRHAIAGDYLFTVKPDSSIRVDAAQDRRQAADLYRFVANDPNVNRVPLLEELFRKNNMDPTRLVVKQLPEKAPEPPKLSLSITGMDLNPLAPQYANVAALLATVGVKLPSVPQPMAAAALQTEHGGLAQQEAGLGAASQQPTGKLPGPTDAAAVN